MAFEQSTREMAKAKERRRPKEQGFGSEGVGSRHQVEILGEIQF